MGVHIDKSAINDPDSNETAAADTKAIAEYNKAMANQVRFLAFGFAGTTTLLLVALGGVVLIGMKTKKKAT